ncbi:MAG: DNA-processing protein DprA [Patescibacteria group bacterium]|jgi:DNA processing protein
MKNYTAKHLQPESLALLTLACFDKWNLEQLITLKKCFGSYQSLIQASLGSLITSGLKQSTASEFISWRKNFKLSPLINLLASEQIGFISYLDPDYPQLLLEISAPPLGLFFRGNIALLTKQNQARLAIVGAREATNYAQQTLDYLMPTLVAANLEIVSGLALGVDALAHQATLDNQGTTIAVLGTGLDRANWYPRRNISLAKNIIANQGLLLSEFPPQTPALPTNFPRRNRIISGLCQATLIVQAKLRSGSLITARLALEQNREVLAIPGDIFSPLSQGANNLIAAGAKPILQATDILESFSNLPQLGIPVTSSTLKGVKIEKNC